MRASAAVLLLFAAPGFGQEPEWRGRYDVAFERDGDVPVARVEAVFTWLGARGRFPDWAPVEMTDGGFEGGYGAFVRDFEPFRPEGAPKPKEPFLAELLDAEHARHRVPVLRDGTLAYRYTVVLEHDPEKLLGTDETPHAFGGGVFWTGRALFAAPRPATFELAFRAPKGERVAASHALHPKEKGVYLAADERALRECFLAVGEHDALELDVEGSTVLLEVGDGLADATKTFAETIEEFFGATAELAGGPPPDRSVVLMSKTALPGELSGAVFGRDVRVVVDKELDETNEMSWRPLLCHELFHLYNGYLVRFEDRQMWFSEGWTDYFTWVLLTRTGRVSPARLLDTYRGRATGYLEQAKADPRGLIAAGVRENKNRTLIYDGGALAALCLDLLIRDASGNRRSLDDVFAGLYEDAEGGRRVTLDDLRRRLKKAGGKSVAGFLERHVEGDEPLPLAECLALAGVTLVAETLELPEYEPCLVDLLQTPGSTSTGRGILIQRTNASGLKVDDVLVELAGHVVEGFGDLPLALRGAEPGSKVPAVVRRKGERKEVDVRLGRPDGPLPTAAVFCVLLELDPKPSKKALAIRASAFGSDFR